MKVWPKNEDMRKLLKHEPSGVGFHAEGPAEWPDDTFTYRRIQDGDVTTEQPAQVEGEGSRQRAKSTKSEGQT